MFKSTSVWVRICLLSNDRFITLENLHKHNKCSDSDPTVTNYSLTVLFNCTSLSLISFWTMSYSPQIGPPKLQSDVQLAHVKPFQGYRFQFQRAKSLNDQLIQSNSTTDGLLPHLPLESDRLLHWNGQVGHCSTV